MSGNMSFFNGNSGIGRNGLGGRREEHERERLHNNSRSSGRRTVDVFSSSAQFGGRGSLSYSEVGSPSSSFVDEGRLTEGDVVKDSDIWGTRIILSALEDISFSKTSYPKLSPRLVNALQKLSLSVNGAVSKCNPFVEQRHDKLKNTSVGGTSNVSTLDESYNSCQEKSPLEISLEILDVLENAPVESKIVLRTLITSYIRKVAMKIIDVWKPILKANGTEFSYAKQPSSRIPTSRSFKHQPESSSGKLTLADYNLPECLESILSMMRTYQTASHNLNLELRTFLKHKNEEMLKYKQNAQLLKEITLAILREKSAMEDLNFVREYLRIVDLESECIVNQLRLEKLHIEAAEEHEESRKETEENYQKIKVFFDEMEQETLEMEESIEKYKHLASDDEYSKILQEYLNLEEEIKTKEWVKEQLMQGPKDDSLLKDDSFFN